MLKGKEINFVDPDLTSDSMGDPAEHGFPTATEAPNKQFSQPWITRSHHKDAPVARIYTYNSRPMTLVRDEVHRAYGLTNPTTGEVVWIPFDEAPFGIDQTKTVVELAPYLESGIAQSDTPLAKILQKDGAPKYSADDAIRKRNGNPNRRSDFKPQFMGNRRIR